MTKINFTNLPDTSTPINATNMNQLQTNVENAINATQISLENEITALPGEIIASGSNTNGNYTKFSDGTMICYKSVTVTAAINNAWGSVYETSNSVSFGNFPETFISAPIVTVEPTGTGCWVEGLNDTNTTQVGNSYLARAVDTSSRNYSFNIIAIGRWK